MSAEPSYERMSDREVRLEAGVADAGGVHSLDLHPVARGEPRQGSDHREAVVAVG